jgi:hypothetical protein
VPLQGFFFSCHCLQIRIHCIKGRKEKKEIEEVQGSHKLSGFHIFIDHINQITLKNITLK